MASLWARFGGVGVAGGYDVIEMRSGPGPGKAESVVETGGNGSQRDADSKVGGVVSQFMGFLLVGTQCFRA